MDSPREGAERIFDVPVCSTPFGDIAGFTERIQPMPTEASERRLVLVSRYAQRDAATIGASHPEFVLRDGMAPLCGFAVPSDGYSVILRDATAVDVPHLEVELRLDVALLGGFAVPSDGFSVILRDAFDQPSAGGGG